MKILRLLILLSILGNAGLGLLLFKQSAVTLPMPLPQRATVTDTPAPAAIDATLPVSWENLDLHAYTEELRRCGFSGELLRSLVYVRIEDHLWSQLRPWAAFAGIRWTIDGISNDQERHEHIRAASKERDRLRRELLGEDAEDPAQLALVRDRYGDLSLNKLVALESIEADYQEMMSASRGRAASVSAEDQKKLQLLQAEREADLAALLTPEERTAYAMRSSQLAYRLRHQLAHMQPTEQEFISIFRAYEFVENGHNSNGTARRASVDELHAARALLTEQLAAALGPERFAEFELKGHPSWQAAKQWVEQQRLSPALIADLATFARTTENRIQELHTRQVHTADSLKHEFNALREESLLRLHELLPPGHVEAYKAGPGRWMRAVNNLER